ncbi:MAG: peptide chain release factor N(5)-glutamine methyltransferase [Pseudohongiella sp.]|uniref:peptide chain release factor N(5)-glutamine methyltransferase n=1 Tax=Pseudohongiella sp. TaxID=1979412 RepID=UPI0034A06DC4
MTVSIRQALDQATTALVLSDSARLDAEVLLAFVLGKSRSFLFSRPESVLSGEQSAAFAAFVARRAAGEPVAYLTGCRGFWTLDLQVTPAVLIPRPETELLVELTLTLGQQVSADDPGRAMVVADLGTGSGAIALALASERQHWQVYATDRSEQALVVARQNAVRLRLDGVSFTQGDWCEALPAAVCFDMIVSNPPYIADDDPHLQQGDLLFEPRAALVADGRGLRDLAIICEQSRLRLRDGGYLLLEHGHEQGADVRALLTTQGFAGVRSERDLAGHERVTLGRHAAPGENTHA